MATVQDVRFGLLALSRAGDDLRGGEWEDVLGWHRDVVEYVRAALGDGPAADVALRLRCSRGSTQAEKEANAIGFINDWLGTQVVGLTEAKIVPGFDRGAIEWPAADPGSNLTQGSGVDEAVEPEPEVAVAVAAEQEAEDGDTGPAD